MLIREALLSVGLPAVFLLLFKLNTIRWILKYKLMLNLITLKGGIIITNVGFDYL